jgi:hypothetical protein
MSTMDKSQYFDEHSDYEDKVVEEPPKEKVKKSPDSSMFDLFHKAQEKSNLKFLESESGDDDFDTVPADNDGDTESEDDEAEA